MSFLTDIFGKTKVDAPAPIQYTPPGFSGGGLSTSFSGNSYNVTPDANRTGVVNSISQNFGALGDTLGTLRAGVMPGYNDLLSARMTQINDTAHKAIGDLRQNLQSRRVLGSSFGQDTLTRANAEFGRQRDQVTADNYLQSLEASNKLLTQQYDAYNKQYATGLSELNLEAGVAQGLTGQAATILGQNAQLEAKLREQSAEFNATMSNNQASGFGKAVGAIGSIGLAPFTGGLSLAALPAFTGATNKTAAAST